ncbi:MAG: hypothetical protein WC644_12350 [Ignavibacteria bacterium]
MKDIVDERLFLRAANINLFRSFDKLTMMEKGVANDNEITVRAIIYLMTGHEIYHINFLKENYL